ncbi:MAG: radical SAM protein [Pseudodesulfovibrio sp.]
MPHFPFIEVHAVDHCNNNCRWCHNYSPFSPQKEYEAKDYFEGLDFLVKNKITINTISLMGGEPFLHSDITRFAFDLFKRYRTPLMITTNGFWLSEESIKEYKHLWTMLSMVKVSRYPTIEKRLGGAKEFKRLVGLIKQYNPKIIVEFPDKGHFNKLEFYTAPIEPELFCANSQCSALLPDMKVGRCGAGAYAHLAPEGSLTEEFKNSNHMLYDLRTFDWQSFRLWRRRYPLDACNYCSFGQKTRSGSWKVEQGRKPFNREYELNYYYNSGKNQVFSQQPQKALNKANFMIENYGEKPEAFILSGLASLQLNDVPSAVNSFSHALKLDPTNRDARGYLANISKEQHG